MTLLAVPPKNICKYATRAKEADLRRIRLFSIFRDFALPVNPASPENPVPFFLPPLTVLLLQISLTSSHSGVLSTSSQPTTAKEINFYVN